MMDGARTHRNGCRCPVCDDTIIACGAQGCEHTSRGKLLAGQHAATHRHRKRRRLIVLQPDGVGFLRRALTEKTLAQALDLSAITRFQSMLLGGTSPADAPAPRGRNWRMTRVDKIALAAYEAMPHNKVVIVHQIRMTANMAASIYRIALLAGVSPRNAIGALLTYGMEHLTQELRLQKTAPAPSARPIPAPQKPTALFPGALS